MDVTWMGHSCFRLRSEQSVLLTDPYDPDTLGLGLADVAANTVTISHEHPHHNATARVSGAFKVFRRPGEYEYMGALVKGVMTSRGPGDPPEKRNTAYHFEVEGVRLVHLGDVSSPLKPDQVEDLTPVDVVFVPVGGGCTVALPQAMDMVRALGPRVVVPMHYSLPGMVVPLGELDAFLREMGAGQVEPQARLNVTPSNLPPELRVVVLNAQGLRAVRPGQGALL